MGKVALLVLLLVGCSITPISYDCTSDQQKVVKDKAERCVMDWTGSNDMPVELHAELMESKRYICESKVKAKVCARIENLEQPETSVNFTYMF